MSFNVGINVVEVDGRATPSIEAAPTSVTGFSIKAQRGIPGQVVRVTNWGQFVEHFGSYMDGAYGAYCVRGFFDNGGTTAYVTRVVHMGTSKASAASISSNNGPWNLHDGDSLTFASDILASPVTVTFTFGPATLQGGTGPFNLSGDQGTGMVLSNGAAPRPADKLNEINFIVNGRAADGYQFGADDFAAGPFSVTADEVAAVLNREFTGIQAWVDSVTGELRVRTDRGDTGASIEATGSAAAVLGLDGGRVHGTGNVAYINAVTAAEAAAVINGVLGPAGFLVTRSGDGVEIKHPDTGKPHWIQVVDEGDTIPTTFGFDNQQHTGEDATTTGAAVASSHTFQNTATGASLTVKAGYRGKEDVGAWSNNTLTVTITTKADEPKRIDLFDLTVKQQDRVVEIWPGLSMQDVESVINDEYSGSKFIIVAATGTGNLLDSSKSMLTEVLTDGSDGASPEPNAFTASIDLFNLFDIQLLCCPETDEADVVNACLTHCEQKGDRMFVGHTPYDHEVDKFFDIQTSYSKGLQRDKAYGALYFPWIQVANPIGTRKWIPPTGHILGVYARTEHERGIWKAPAGNAARLNGALDVRYHITDTDHTTLVKSASVNAVRFISGQGIVIDSSRTLSTSPLWLYVNVRLLFNFVKSSLKSGLRWVVQEPNDNTLWNKVKFNSVTPFLMGLWRRGAFGPGSPEEVFTVKVDAENNPPANIQQGIFTVEVYFYPSRPAETIIITIGQQEGGGSAGEG